MDKRIRVAIVGGGVSGISAVKECLDGGLEPVCFEQHDQIGGVWYYTEERRPKQGGAAYASMISNQSKCMSQFSDFPMPKHYPPYVPHNQVYEYLHSYVDNFRLRDYFRLNTEVVQIKRSPDHGDTGNWDVTSRSSDSSSEQSTETFQRVIIAVGLFKCPYVPDVPGKDVFKGTIIHTNDFRRAEVYQNKRVLVIGNANSAGDVATEISHHADAVYMSVGRGMNVFTRVEHSKGIPSDFATRFQKTFYPQWLSYFLLKRLALSVVDHRLYCIESEEMDLYKAPVCFNDEIVYRLSCGKILPKTYVKEFTANGAIFQDGSRVDGIDCVIFATGYDLNFRIMEDGIVSASYPSRRHELDLYKSVWPVRTEHNTLAVVGMVIAPEPVFMVFELQCRWIAQVFSGRINLPPKADMCKSMKIGRKLTLEATGEKFLLPSVLYRDQIADIIGAKPNFWQQLFTDPVLAFKCFFGPAFPVHYRLSGPHAWSGARQAALEAYEDTFSGLRTRGVSKKDESGIRELIIFLAICCIVCSVIIVYFA